MTSSGRSVRERRAEIMFGHRMGTDLHRVAHTRTLSGLLRASPRDLRRRWSEGPPPTTTSVLWPALSSNTYLARGMLAPPPKARASPAHDRDPCFVQRDRPRTRHQTTPFDAGSVSRAEMDGLLLSLAAATAQARSSYDGQSSQAGEWSGGRRACFGGVRVWRVRSSACTDGLSANWL